MYITHILVSKILNNNRKHTHANIFTQYHHILPRLSWFSVAPPLRLVVWTPQAWIVQALRRTSGSLGPAKIWCGLPVGSSRCDLFGGSSRCDLFGGSSIVKWWRWQALLVLLQHPASWLLLFFVVVIVFISFYQPPAVVPSLRVDDVLIIQPPGKWGEILERSSGFSAVWELDVSVSGVGMQEIHLAHKRIIFRLHVMISKKNWSWLCQPRW